MRVNKTVSFFSVCSLLLVVIFTVRTPAQQPAAVEEKGCEDDYSTPTIVWFMKLRQGISIGALDERDVPRLGDAASIALLKLYSEEELLQPKTLQRALQGIRESFSSTCSTKLPSDKAPRVTVFLLEDLARQTKDYQSKVQILDTLTYVKQQTAAVHCEEPE